MRASIFLGVLFLWVLQLEGQTPFKRCPQVQYKRIAFNEGTRDEDSLFEATASLGKLRTLSNLQIDICASSQWSDSSRITISRHGKPLKQFSLRASVYNIADSIFIADLDHDGRLDMKIVMGGTGSGLASLLNTKLYIFNTSKGFKAVSFFDFAYEPEYDLNHDSIFEILGKEHVIFRGHSYWIYNVYNFRDGRLINVSRQYKYPYWTKFLYRDIDGVPASNLSFKDRLTGLKPTPGIGY